MLVEEVPWHPTIREVESPPTQDDKEPGQKYIEPDRPDPGAKRKSDDTEICVFFLTNMSVRISHVTTTIQQPDHSYNRN